MPKLTLNASKKTKHTPAGEIPVDWGCVQMKDCAGFVGGSQPPQSTFIFEPKPGYVRLLQIRDYKSDRYPTYIPKELSKRSCNDDDIMIGRYGPPIFQILRGKRGSYNVALIKVVPTELVDREYLYLLLKQDSLFQLIDTLSARTSGQTGIDMDALKTFPVPLPPLSEQRRIAEILSTWDRAIETLESLIAAKERRKQALMEQLLSGRKRLPGFAGKWSKVKLSELLTPIVRAIAKPSSPFLAAGIRCHGRGVFLKSDFKPADIMLDELYEIRTNDLVVNITFAWEGAIAIVQEEANGALVSHRFPTYLFKQDLTCSEFFRHVIQTHGFVFECGLASPGGAGRNRVLSKKNFLKIAIPCPELREQQAIAAVLDTTDRELTLHRQHLATLRAQKRGLMKLLLTGRVRVKTT